MRCGFFRRANDGGALTCNKTIWSCRGRWLGAVAVLSWQSFPPKDHRPRRDGATICDDDDGENFWLRATHCDQTDGPTFDGDFSARLPSTTTTALDLHHAGADRLLHLPSCQANAAELWSTGRQFDLLQPRRRRASNPRGPRPIRGLISLDYKNSRVLLVGWHASKCLSRRCVAVSDNSKTFEPWSHDPAMPMKNRRRVFCSTACSRFHHHDNRRCHDFPCVHIEYTAALLHSDCNRNSPRACWITTAKDHPPSPAICNSPTRATLISRSISFTRLRTLDLEQKLTACCTGHITTFDGHPPTWLFKRANSKTPIPRRHPFPLATMRCATTTLRRTHHVPHNRNNHT